MKRSLALVLCLCVLLALLSGCKQEAVEEKFIKIGLLEPLTGDDALGGNQERLGVQFARSLRPTVTINGESYTVKLVEKDTTSSIEKTVYAARELAEEEVALVLGAYGSSACNVAAAPLEEAHISAIGISCTDPNVTSNHRNYYRVGTLDELQARLLAQYAFEYGARVAYCLAQTDRDYDRMMCDAFLKEFKALGGTVVTTVTTIEYNTYSTALNNFADYINGAVMNKTDLMFAPIPVRKGVQLIQECAAADVKFSILGDDTWDTPEIAEAVLDTYMYVACASIFPEDRNELSMDYVSNCQDGLNADPARIEANGGTTDVSAASALAYDAYMTAIAALELSASAEAEDVSKALPGVVWEGVTGSIRFNDLGDPDKTELFIKRADTFTGTWVYNKAQQLRLTPTATEE